MELNVQRRIGDCEACDKTSVIVKYLHGNRLSCCEECYQKEIQAQVDSVNSSVKEKQEVFNMNIAITKAQEIDSSINVRTDLFNAATVSIVELKATIDADESLTNKPFALATELMTRFAHFKNVVFELNQKIVEAGNQQKAIQIYLNQLANSLRADEREKLKIADINYKPSAPKSITVKAIKTTAKKLDKVELRKYAAELNISEFTLQMIVVSKGITVEAAARMLRHSINAAKSE